MTKPKKPSSTSAEAKPSRKPRTASPLSGAVGAKTGKLTAPLPSPESTRSTGNRAGARAREEPAAKRPVTKSHKAERVTKPVTPPVDKKAPNSVPVADVPAQPKPKRKKRALRRPPGLTVEQVVRALRASAGVRSLAAQALGVDRSTITHFAKRHPEIEAIEEDIRETYLDIAEAKLVQAINAGEMQAVRYFLDQHGAARGYGRKTTLRTDPNEPLLTKDVGAASDVAAAVKSGKITVADLKQLRAIAAKVQGAGNGAPSG